MKRYRIITLVDITRSNVSRYDADYVKINQQANFNTLLQTIELRSNVSWSSDPQRDLGTLPSPFEGKAAYWTWDFEVERDDLFLKDGDPVLLLKQDLNNVPIICGLEETVDLEPPVFKTSGNINTYIKIM